MRLLVVCQLYKTCDEGTCTNVYFSSLFFSEDILIYVALNYFASLRV